MSAKSLAVVSGFLFLLAFVGVQLLKAAQSPTIPFRPADLMDAANGSPAAVADLFRDVARAFDPAQTDNAAPYEEQTLAAVAKFQTTSGVLPLRQRLVAMETVLTVALRQSLGTRERPAKGPNPWETLQTDLERKLVDVRLRLLRAYTIAARDEPEWQHALHFGDNLAASYPGDTAVLAAVGRQRVRYAAFVFLHASKKQPGPDYTAIRRQLEWCDEHVPELVLRSDPFEAVGDALLQAGRPLLLRYRPDAQVLRQFLVRKATSLFASARQAKDDRTAVQALQAALEIWPRLPGLHDELLKRQGHYTILNVGVRTLPKYLSPARATADSELQALELLFESVLQTRPTSDGALIFEPQLAASLPQLANNARNFTLKKTAHWSNGGRVTSSDVARTFELLTSAKLPGHSAELADQVEPIRAGDDLFRFQAKPRQGLLEPLAPFTFKVLPRAYGNTPLTGADDEAFALAPVGSGPFMPGGILREHDRTYVRFVANPYYMGPDDAGGPKIREVRFFVSSDPSADFANKTAPLHLLLDASPQALGKLKAAGVSEFRSLSSRRVWFLAVNHRDPVLADEPLRRALAHAINRDQALADAFGGGRPNFRAAPLAAWGVPLPILAAALEAKGAAGEYRPLNGPYPAGSWACCSDGRVPASLFDRAKAETFMRKAKSKTVDLELKYPDDDPHVASACQAIAAQLADLGERTGGSIKLRLVPLPPWQLQRDLQAHRYQLAYWRHDFPDDTYSLWPLFDPREEAMTTGSNYLGFKDDGTLAELLQRAGSYRDFNEVKRLTHDIHVVLFERMPLIPLWQLDYHLAVHPRLKLPARIDPLRVFADIKEWRVLDN